MASSDKIRFYLKSYFLFKYNNSSYSKMDIEQFSKES